MRARLAFIVSVALVFAACEPEQASDPFPTTATSQPNALIGDSATVVATATEAATEPPAPATKPPSTATSVPPTSTSVPAPTQPAQAANCSPAYPTVCIPPAPPDLDCKDVAFKKFTVLAPDPHKFDNDKNGIGCES